MTDQFIKIIGKRPGPKSVILGGVHGNETCGVKALEKLLPNLKIDCGEVWFGFGNPRAIEANTRFVERDLNRMFDDNNLSLSDKDCYEYSRAQFIKQYLDHSSALLDIHASITPSSKPFSICEKNADSIVKYMPVDIIVSGFDRHEPGGTDYYMNKIGGIGVCVECGYLDDPASDRRAEEAIYAFLKARGHIPNDLASRKQKQVEIYELYKTKTNNFKLIKPFSDFEGVEAGQVIGFDEHEPIVAPQDSVILFAKNRTSPGSEAFLLGKHNK